MKTKRALLTAAVAGLVGAGATLQANLAIAADKPVMMVQCWGANSCKQKGACATSHNECANKNACKGKSYLEMTKAECLKKKGKLKEPVEKSAPAQKSG